MIRRIIRLLSSSLLLTGCLSVFLQVNTLDAQIAGILVDSLKKNGVIIGDTIKKPEISLSKDQAVKFLEQQFQPQNWKDSNDPFRKALGQLIFQASNPPYDSSVILLRSFPYDSIKISWDKFYIWEPLKLKIRSEVPPVIATPADTVVKADTNVVEVLPDSIRLAALNLQVKHDTGTFEGNVKDTTIMIVLDTLDEAISNYARFPFRSFRHPFQADSIEVAVKSLMKYLEERDSTKIYFTGADNLVTPLWMNSKLDKMARYWLKNEFSDSVTIWIGNPSRDTIGLYLEKGVSFRRPVRQENYSGAKINVQAIDNSKLLNSKKIDIKQQYWKYRTEASLIFSQSALSNWVKGGENSISTALDVTGYADYMNPQLKLSSNNFIRLKLGFLKSGDNPIRKNLDLLETNSKLNHKAFGKFDFSAILLFKTQIAPGYNYATEPYVLVSKFLNPAIVTVGFGLDYKPNKVTSINFSPLSYKGTFVTDTARIDQTKYGIPRDKKSINEPGVSFMITNEYRPLKNVAVTNRLQLFTNYIHNPQNIDVDWEMIVVTNLNWFTDVRFNTHLIFDDDTRTVVLDKDKKPVLRPDGTQKKTSRIQFKELFGLSFVFRF
jgi:hypothetical protein